MLHTKKSNNKNAFIYIGIFLLILFCIWEFVAKNQSINPKWKMVFPPLEDIVRALLQGFTHEYSGTVFWMYVINSLLILMAGLFIGVSMALVLSCLSVVSNVFRQVYVFIVNIFDLLPGVAILPIAIIIFGVSPSVIIALVVHSVIWPMSHNILDGFSATPQMFIESAQNMEMKANSLLLHVYIPSALHYIISGLKVGWARAWRGLISAEMIFGIVSVPGIGMFINLMRTNMKNAELYACLLVIILIGAVVQYGILIPLERATVKKWGM